MQPDHDVSHASEYSRERVAVLANCIPFQDPQGGPNFYMFDPNALYEIHIANFAARRHHLDARCVPGAQVFHAGAVVVE